MGFGRTGRFFILAKSKNWVIPEGAELAVSYVLRTVHDQAFMNQPIRRLEGKHAFRSRSSALATSRLRRRLDVNATLSIPQLLLAPDSRFRSQKCIYEAR